MLSHAGMFLLGQNQAVLKKAPRYPEEPQSGVAFHLQLEPSSSVSERVEVRGNWGGEPETICVCGPGNDSSTRVKAPCGVFFFFSFFFVNKLKVFSHSLFLTALVNFLTHELWIKANVCIFNIGGAGRRIAFSEQQWMIRCGHSAQKRVRYHYWVQFSCGERSRVFSFPPSCCFFSSGHLRPEGTGMLTSQLAHSSQWSKLQRVPLAHHSKD